MPFLSILLILCVKPHTPQSPEMSDSKRAINGVGMKESGWLEAEFLCSVDRTSTRARVSKEPDIDAFHEGRTLRSHGCPGMEDDSFKDPSTLS